MRFSTTAQHGARRLRSPRATMERPVSCPSNLFCMATTTFGDAVTYDGTAWSTPTSIESSSFAPISVSCPSSSFCAAVDHDGNALNYNGTSWTSPAAVDPGSNLTSVSCASSSLCVAVDGDDHALTYPVTPPSITTTSLPGGTVGSSYSGSLAATGGATPYTWSISSGSLPSGLFLNASTGAITGTPNYAGRHRLPDIQGDRCQRHYEYSHVVDQRWAGLGHHRAVEPPPPPYSDSR